MSALGLAEYEKELRETMADEKLKKLTELSDKVFNQDIVKAHDT